MLGIPRTAPDAECPNCEASVKSWNRSPQGRLVCPECDRIHPDQARRYREVSDQ